MTNEERLSEWRYRTDIVSNEVELSGLFCGLEILRN